MKRIWKKILFVVFLIFAGSTVSEVACANVNATFAKADRAFKKGQTKSALKIISSNIRKYPAHQPSQMLLGRIYYRLGKVQKAARAFKRVDPGMVNGEVAYEYGISLFMVKNYDKALKGFNRVPRNSRQFGLANFYKAVCLMQNQQWQAAMSALRRAKKLPRNLLSSKNRLMRTLKSRLRDVRRGASPQIATGIIVPPPPVAAPPMPYPSDPSAPNPPKKEDKPAPPPPPKSGLQTTVSPGIVLEQKQASQSFHGTGEASNESTKTTLKLGFKARYDAEPRSHGGQPYVQLGVDLKNESTNSRGESVVYVAPADDPTDIREERADTEPATTENLTLQMVPEAGFPVSNFLDLTAGYVYKDVYPEGKSEGKTGSRSPYATADMSFDSLSVKLSFNMLDSIGIDGEVTSTSTTFKGELDKSWDSVSGGISVSQTTNETPSGPANPESSMVFGGDFTKSWDSFSMTAEAKQTSYTPPAGAVKLGSQSDLYLALSGNKSFDFGATLTLTGSMTQQADIITEYDDPTAPPPTEEGAAVPKVQVKTQGTLQKFTGSFKISPVGWIYGKVTISTSKNEYSVGDDRFVLEFEKSNAELATESALEVGLSTSF